jgi:DNA-binding NarL/FixJ family response regulator
MSPVQPARSQPGAVLVVEDELLVGIETCIMLEYIGCRPLGPASTIEGAITLIESDRPACALLDEDLMGASVAPVARRLHEQGIPFAIVSGYSESISGDAVTRAAPRCLKPLTYSALFAILETLNGGACIAGGRRKPDPDPGPDTPSAA